jgi:hypothetical protein
MNHFQPENIYEVSSAILTAQIICQAYHTGTQIQVKLLHEILQTLWEQQNQCGETLIIIKHLIFLILSCQRDRGLDGNNMIMKE